MTAPAVAPTTGGYRLVGPHITVTVPGAPVGQGNIRHLGAGRPAVHQNAAVLLPWRQSVAAHAMLAARGARHLRWPLDGPVAVEVTFTVAKPRSAPKRRRTWPVTRPDLDHYIRAVLDALKQGGVWRDDSQAVEITARKVYPREHPDALPTPGARIRIYTIANVSAAAC